MFQGGIGVPVVAAILACGSLLAAIALLFLRLDTAPPEALEVQSLKQKASAGGLGQAAA
jgi:hypothetical protein